MLWMFFPTSAEDASWHARTNKCRFLCWCWKWQVGLTCGWWWSGARCNASHLYNPLLSPAAARSIANNKHPSPSAFAGRWRPSRTETGTRVGKCQIDRVLSSAWSRWMLGGELKKKVIKQYGDQIQSSLFNNAAPESEILQVDYSGI